MKNKWCKILSVLLLSVILPMAQPAFAAEENPCKPEVQENIKQQLTDNLKTSFNQFKSAVGPYNSLARTYMGNCLDESGNPGPKVRISVDDSVTARAAGVNIEDDSLYEYISIPWGNVRGDTSACIQLLQEVKAAYSPAIEAYNNMRKDIQALKNHANTICTCNDKGEDPRCDTLPETDIVQGQGGKCESFTGIQQRLAACPLCGVFEAALNASARVAHVAWQSTAKPLSEVVIIFFLVLLAIESLKAIGSTAGVKLSTYLKSVLAIGLKIAITVTLLSNSQYIYTLFISPVIRGGLDMGLAIASAGGNIQCDTNPGGYGVIASSELDESLFNQVLSTVRCFGATAATLPAVGMGLICHSAPSGTWGGDLLPDLHMFLSGLIMLAFGLMIWLALSFYLIDCTVQIGMLSALVPLLVACWPFDLTKQYTTKGVKMLMNTFFNFALMGTVLLVGTAIISFAVSGDGSSNMQEILHAVNNNEADTLKKLASLDGIRVLMLLACCIFALKLIAKVSSLAQQFSQGAGADTGSKMASALAGAATVAGQGGLHSAGRLGGYAGNAILENTGLKAGFNELTDKISEAKHSGLQTLGQKIGLGRFQNQQTGSGLQTQSGEDMPPARGATSPNDGNPLPYNDENTLPDNETQLENTNGEETPTAAETNSPSGENKSATNETNTPRSGEEAGPKGKRPTSRTGNSGETVTPLANDAAPADADAEQAAEAPTEAESAEPTDQQQNDKGTQKPQQPSSKAQNNAPAEAETHHNNASEEGVAHNQMATNQNPINAEKTTNKPIEQAQPNNAEQTSRGAVSQNETVAESRQAEQNNRATGGATASSTGATASSTGATAGSTGATASSTGATAGATGATAGSTGATAGATGATASSTGAMGATASLTGATAGSTGATAGATGATAGSTGVTSGSTGATAGNTSREQPIKPNKNDNNSGL